MDSKVEKLINDLKQLNTQLPELRDLYWLKIDRYSEVELQRGVAFDEKFEQQRDKLCRMIDSFTVFVEKSFAPSAEEIAREKALQKLRAEFSGFDDWNEEAKKALLEREIQAFPTVPKSKCETTSCQMENKKVLLLLRVIFPDGTEIANRNATLTFVQAIKKIGIERVVQLKMGRELVREDTNFSGKSARPVSIENYYIDTHSSTSEKKMYLDKISQQLNLNLKVEISES